MSLLLTGARLPGGDGRPVDVLLKHGIVTQVGQDLRGSRSIDLGGRWLIPGLWDEHVHMTQAALASRRVDVSSATSAREAAALLADAPAVASELPLVGYGFRDGLWADVPTTALLDEHLPDRPAVLISADIHACWLNTPALTRFGRTGHPTALLREGDAFPVIAALQNVPDDAVDEWVTAVADDAARRGVVGVVDLEMKGDLDGWTRRFRAGFGTLRVESGVYPDQLDAAIGAGLRTGTVIDGSDGKLTVGPFKVLTDGSLNTRTAYCVSPYPGLSGPSERGLLTVAPGDLLELLRRATSAGFSPAVHAIGDEANRLALDAFEALGCGGRIEHAQLLLDDDFARFARLGVTASVQPEHAMDDRNVADHHWAGRTDRAFALRSLLDAGATLALGSDAPVAPLDPWVTMAAAVTRSRDGLAPWHPEQAIPVADALAASARGRRSVSVGDVADLAVVELDPFAVDPGELRTMPVAATLVGGCFSYDGL